MRRGWHPRAASAWTRHRKAIDTPSRAIPAPAPRRRSLRRRFAKRQRSRPGWPAWPPWADEAWPTRPANRSLPTSTPARRRRPFPPMIPARIESIPPCAPSRLLACHRQAKAQPSGAPRKVRLRAQQSPPRPAIRCVVHVGRADTPRSGGRIRAAHRRVTWGTHRLMHVVEGGPGSRSRANNARVRRCAPPRCRGRWRAPEPGTTYPRGCREVYPLLFTANRAACFSWAAPPAHGPGRTRRGLCRHVPGSPTCHRRVLGHPVRPFFRPSLQL